MRFPWLQVDADFLAHKSQDVAALLGCSRVQAIGHMSLLWAWAVSRGTENAPPTGLVAGVHAVRLIESAAEWEGAAGALFEALCDPDVALLETVPDGVRVRGLDRYAKTWEKQRKDRARKADIRATSDGVPRDGAGKTQKKTQTQKEQPLSASADDQEDLPDATDDAHPVTQSPLFVVETRPEKPKERPEDLQALWNAEAHQNLPRWKELTESRKRKATTRLRERPLSEWREIIQRINASPFLRGEQGTWRASPDWLLQPDAAVKVLEGKYDSAQGAAPTAPPKPVKFVEM